jgi:pseudaminic acid cytidylyltransferase
MNNLCIIPARGGSKRIPRKNIRDFLGKPIIAYSIEAALDSALFKDVIVSTDDEEIASIAIKYGAKVPFIRSKRNSDDFATTVDVLLEVLEEYKKLSIEFDICCCIYPTAPFTNMIKLKEAYHRLLNENLDSVFPVIPFSYPIQRSFKLQKGKISFLYPEFEKVRSQDLDVAFHDAGQYYFFRPETLLESKTIFTNNTGGIIINECEAQDIDNETDWKIAEIKFELT